MDVRLVCDAGIERHGVEELHSCWNVGTRSSGWTSRCDEPAVKVLSEVFGFHLIAVRDCVERNHVSKVHIYPEYVFSVLHAPESRQARPRALCRA